MIHHCYTLQAHGRTPVEVLAPTAAGAVHNYAFESIGLTQGAQLTVAAWRGEEWVGYFKATAAPFISAVEPIATPECFEPLPSPKVTPAVTAPAFASCDPAAQQVAFMALESRARSLGLEAEEHRSVGHDELADILMGQQSACVAALDVLKGVGR